MQITPKIILMVALAINIGNTQSAIPENKKTNLEAFLPYKKYPVPIEPKTIKVNI